jgi:MFS family permease
VKGFDDARYRPHWSMESKGVALAALCSAVMILNLDITIVTVALPDLVRQTGATTTDLQWVVDAYNLVFAALVLVAGSLSDRLGRKGMLLAGIGVFGAASLAGSFATSAGELIGARAVMGLGAAMMFPSTLSLLSNVFTERHERARALGLWAHARASGWPSARSLAAGYRAVLVGQHLRVHDPGRRGGVRGCSGRGAHIA